MGDVPLIPPLMELRPNGRGDTVEDVADYRNYAGALGYCYRFFVNGITRDVGIKLLQIDNVAPTGSNIRSGSYPFVTDVCVVTVRPRDENIRKITGFLFSPAGRELIRKTGYLPLDPPEIGTALRNDARRGRTAPRQMQ